jgi:DNA-binding Lrp family transcriptional regulator
MVARLDEVDRRIIHELTADVRITFAELGARTGLSESQGLRRVRALEKAGVIQGYITFTDPASLKERERRCEAIASRMQESCVPRPELITKSQAFATPTACIVPTLF